MKTIAIMACCDTKYHEVRYVREKISAAGCRPMVLDISTRGIVPVEVEISREKILASGGFTWEDILAMSKDKSISTMSR